MIAIYTGLPGEGMSSAPAAFLRCIACRWNIRGGLNGRSYCTYGLSGAEEFASSAPRAPTYSPTPAR